MEYINQLITFLIFSICSVSFGQNPVIKVDINIPDRQESEVNEPDYVPWPLQNTTGETLTVENITFTLEGSYNTSWYKAGVQAPCYGRLANDGARTETEITLRISGLPNGNHSLLTFHNTFSNPETNTFSPFDVYLNDVLIYDDIIPSNRVCSNLDAQTSYIKFEITDEEDVTISFKPETSSSANNIIANLCGFELNTPNSDFQAKFPIPGDKDKHVDADNDSLILCWTPAPNAISHNIYFSSNFEEIDTSGINSSNFLGNQTDTVFLVTNLNNMTEYYWRVDEIDRVGEITKGDIWSFRPRQIAFPGAEGYGKYAIGGRGGKVVVVSNLEDDGPGSLREAVTNDIGPRTIVFAVSGLITLESRLTLTDDFITVAGQTAPGKGICIRQAPFGMSGASDAIMRHMRVRLGSGTTYDGMGMSGSNFCIIDHCSISWTIDEAFSSRNGKNITLQRTLISEALNVAGHTNYPYGTEHGYAASISGDIGSFHHNLLAHCSGRNWSLAGGLDGDGNFAGRLDIFNNVVYNWHHRVTDGGAHEVNFVNNYYKRGAASETDITYALKAQYENFPGTQKYYFNGNIMPGIFDETNQDNGRIYTGTPDSYSPWVSEPFFPSLAEIHPAREAYKRVLSDVGASQPIFDDHDIRMIRETRDGTFTYRGSYTNLPGIPDAHADVGGWEEYPQMLRAENWDSDLDGMPDWWENAKGLNPDSETNDFTESNTDSNADGYTNLEDYLNWMAKPHYFISQDSTLTINISEYFRAYIDEPVYSVVQVSKGTTSILSDSLVEFIPDSEGLASLTLKVEDQSMDTLQRTIGIFIGQIPQDSLIVTENTSIKESAKMPEQFECYPNPTINQLFITSTENVNELITIKIFDMVGTCVHQTELTSIYNEVAYPIDVSVLETGIYTILINSTKKKELIKFSKIKNSF